MNFKYKLRMKKSSNSACICDSYKILDWKICCSYSPLLLIVLHSLLGHGCIQEGNRLKWLNWYRIKNISQICSTCKIVYVQWNVFLEWYIFFNFNKRDWLHWENQSYKIVLAPLRLRSLETIVHTKNEHQNNKSTLAKWAKRRMRRTSQSIILTLRKSFTEDHKGFSQGLSPRQQRSPLAREGARSLAR